MKGDGAARTPAAPRAMADRMVLPSMIDERCISQRKA